MRRTDEEFKAEVLRRTRAYQIRRKKRRAMVAAFCLPLLLCCGAMMALISAGYGGSTEKMADNAYSMMSMADAPEEPAAMAPQAPAAEEYIVEDNIKAESAAVYRSVEIIFLGDTRVFTEPTQIDAIVDAIAAFSETAETIPAGGEIGDAEGYRIILTEGSTVREYSLFNNALILKGESEWLVNPECYQLLEQLIIVDGN